MAFPIDRMLKRSKMQNWKRMLAAIENPPARPARSYLIVPLAIALAVPVVVWFILR